MPSSPGTIDNYAQLKNTISTAGLLDKNPARYIGKILAATILMAVSIAILIVTDNIWIQMGNAALLAFTTVQLCFLGHDAGHQQVFRTTRNNDRLGLVTSLLVGINRTWWVNKHNQHHGNPNDIDGDPDVNLPLIAFSVQQAQRSTGVTALIIRHQAVLFYPLTCLESFVLKASGIPRLLRRDVKYQVAEPAVMVGHIVLYAGLIFWCLPGWEGVVFLAVHHILTGLYVSATFAPNHKGMLMTDDSSKIDFLSQQVLTSRNVRPSPTNDMLYGGLNYQIEHHLFPTMPRHNLSKARPIIMDFCRRNGISYHETGLIQSHREILQYLHQVSAPLRNRVAH